MAHETELTDKGVIIRGKRTSMVLVNPNDRDWTSHRYVMAFGAYGSTILVAWANSLDDALDECIDWIADHEPGLLADEQVAEAYREAIADGATEDEAAQHAETDTTCGGNEGHYLLSWEWDIVCEDPTRAQLLDIVNR